LYTAAWLFAGLQRHGWPVICIDARHAAAALQAGFPNKNERNDARGIAALMRVNKYRPVWVKSPEAQRQGRLLTARATLQSQLVALENTISGLLRQEGSGLTDRRTAFELAVREAIGDDGLLRRSAFGLDAARIQLGRGELPRADQQDGRPRGPAAAPCGGVLRHRHQRKPRRHRPTFFRAHAVPSGTAVRSPVREGRGWDASEAARLVRTALRATPTTRMAPSRSNFPYPAPITCVEARREGCHLREIE
jgi:hypothetical protein